MFRECNVWVIQYFSLPSGAGDTQSHCFPSFLKTIWFDCFCLGINSCCHQERKSKYHHVSLISKLIKWNWKKAIFQLHHSSSGKNIKLILRRIILLYFICVTSSIQENLKTISTSHEIASGKCISIHGNAQIDISFWGFPFKVLGL